MLSSSVSNSDHGDRSGGPFSSLGDSIIHADDAMNKMLNSPLISSVGQTFNKIGFGLPLVHLLADAGGNMLFKGMEAFGRMLGGKGSVDYHFDKEWGAGKSASACKPRCREAAEPGHAWGDGQARCGSHAMRFESASAHSGFGNAGFGAGAAATRFDAAATRSREFAASGSHPGNTTQTRFHADGGVTQTQTRVASGSLNSRGGWADAGFGVPSMHAGAAFLPRNLEVEPLHRDAARLHRDLLAYRAVNAQPFDDLAARNGLIRIDVRYA